MSHVNRPMGPMTTAIHAGEAPDPATKASAPALHMSSTFVVEEAAGFPPMTSPRTRPGFMRAGAIRRWTCWTARSPHWGGVEACLCSASGMAAASAIFFTFLSAGDHVLVSDVSYAGVAELVRDTLPRLGIEASLVNMSDLEAVAAALRPNTRLVHAETPVNPIGRLTDLAAVATLAHEVGALMSVDSTFASPIATRRADFGVDLVMHSITKYIGGHRDVVGGAVAGARDLIAKLRGGASIHHGGILSPFNAWLIARGAATLPLRMRAHEAGATAVAQWLEADPRVSRVIYPGLDSHPQRDLARAQMKSSSGRVSFQVGNAARGKAVADCMMDRLEVIHYAVSLGHHRSLVFWMPTEGLMESSFRLEGAALKDDRAYAGDGIFRLSVGLEDAEDLIADLDQVL